MTPAETGRAAAAPVHYAKNGRQRPPFVRLPTGQTRFISDAEAKTLDPEDLPVEPVEPLRRTHE